MVLLRFASHISGGEESDYDRKGKKEGLKKAVIAFCCFQPWVDIVQTSNVNKKRRRVGVRLQNKNA